jgi:signal transduction histidine kinase
VADVILPRFGEFLLNHRYITEDQLHAALIRQRESAAAGRKITIGQILLEMGAVTREQLEWASIQQVRQLQTTLQESNRQLEQCVNQNVQELRRALQKLNELNQLKANFVSTVTHELRTPLSHIQGYRDLLANGFLGPINTGQREALEVIARATTHLGRLINELIRFAASAKGEMKVNLNPVSPNDLGVRVLEASTPKAAEGNVRLRSEVPPSLPLVLADGDQIYWVVFQLLDNAIKFTPAGGEVILRMERRDDRVRVSVRDTGIGIPPERVSEVFEPFHQLDSSSTRPYGGMGLGLALVQRLLEAHQSQIAVESQPGQGSIFSFELRLAPSSHTPD